MKCINCKNFYTDGYNRFTGYCKMIDRYDSMQLYKCPCFQKLNLKDKILLKLQIMLHVKF